MRPIVRRHLPVAITTAVVCSLFMGGPVVARAAFDALNADKVDGRHAVAASATVDARKGALVATSSTTGQLPNNIIAKAPDSDLLDGLNSSEIRVAAGGTRGGFANVNGCGAGIVHSYGLRLGRTARLFVAATSTYGRSNPGPERPTIRVQLLDASDAIVAETERVSVDGTSGNPSLTVAGMLLTSAGSPFEGGPGSFTLRIWADNFGACTGFGQYQQPALSHLVIPTGT